MSGKKSRALRIKAAETERSLSQIINDAVRQTMAEDAEDLAAFEERAKEPNLAFEALLRDLRRRLHPDGPAVRTKN